MSLNVLNKRFLSLLCHIGIDIDVFPDKTFDGLFERRHNELNYFLEWFVDNITPENALTEAEVDIYQYLNACDTCLTDEELNYALLKWIPSYEDLEILDGDYIDTSLTGELEEINVEYELLKTTYFDLESKYGELKRKPNHLKEECNRTRKKLEQIKDQLEVLNLYFSPMHEDINDCNLSNCCNVADLSKFKNSAEEQEILVEKFRAKNFQCDQIIHLLNVKSNDISKLKMNLKTSKYCSIVSKSLLEDVKCESLRAEEFLHKLKDESDNNFTFEEVLSIWFDVNELITYDELLREIDCVQVKALIEHLDKECELICHNFLSRIYYHKLCDNNNKILKHSEFLKHIKLDIVNNLLLQQFIDKSRDKEEELAHLISGFYCLLNKNQNSIKNAIENIMCKDKKMQDYFRNLNEKHALWLSCNRNLGNWQENVSCAGNYETIKLLLNSPFFCPEEFMNKLEKAITAGISNVLRGPTNQIKMAPVEVELEFIKCNQLLAENSHSIQRLLTEYVNTKESISSSNRRHLLLWIDFLINPAVITTGLEQLQEESIRCASKLPDGSNI